MFDPREKRNTYFASHAEGLFASMFTVNNFAPDGAEIKGHHLSETFTLIEVPNRYQLPGADRVSTRRLLAIPHLPRSDFAHAHAGL